MAIGWLAVLQLVPWADVISNAPKVVEGAKKLWKTVSRQTPASVPATDLSDAAGAANGPTDAHTLALLQGRVATLEALTGELHQHMLASSELIKTLAEQNTQLIRRMELSRLRFLMLAGATAMLGVLAAAALVVALVR